PSLNLIVVRNGEALDAKKEFNDALDSCIVRPLMRVFLAPVIPSYPPSPVIKSLTFAPASTIVRKASGSDCWPLTWGDDDNLYTAYGDGTGFEPGPQAKLSLGLVRVAGPPSDFHGINIPSPTVEQ